MIKHIFFIPLTLLVSKVFCQNTFDAKLIPEKLLRNVNYVTRMDETTIEIESIGKANITTKVAYTVLNSEGAEKTMLVEHYDKLESIKSIEGVIYDKDGNKVKKISKKDIRDVSGTSENTLADDHRLKIYECTYPSYPYTVYYEVERRLNGIFYLPGFRPIDNDKSSVENASFHVSCPKDYQLRYKALYGMPNPTIHEEGNSITYHWELKQLEAIEKESFSKQNMPQLFVAPTRFEIENYAGQMDNWKNFGLFYNQLNKGRDVLPEKVKNDVHVLVDKEPNVKNKIALLYNYLKRNTYYVNVSLGIGGWQTFDANYVATKGYGDCKALSNYMVSLLKEVGIPAYCALIYAGENKADSVVEDFPSNQFNHVIVNVPLAKDSIWLECTSATSPMNYLGGFTKNRKALLIKEDGGVLLHTPNYSSEQNMQIRNIASTVDATGNAACTIRTLYKAEEQELVRSLSTQGSASEITKYLNEGFDIASYELTKYNYEQINEAIPSIHETLSLAINNYATVTSKRLFIVPNVMSKHKTKIDTDSTRKQPIYVRYGFTEIDTVTISILKGYTIETALPTVNIVNEFGSYQTSFTYANETITYYRKLVIKEGVFAPSKWGSFKQFRNTVYEKDREKMVLVKGE